MSLIASLLLAACLVPAFAAAPAKPVSKFAKTPVPELIAQMYKLRGQDQREVIDELIRRGPEADEPLLRELSKRESTILLIFARKGAPAVPRLLKLIASDTLTLAAGKALLQAATPQARTSAPALLACTRKNPEFQYCGMALARVMSPASAAFTPKLVAALSDKQPLARTFAAVALGGIGPGAASAVPALAARLGDKEPSVAWAAAAALGKLGRSAKPAIPALEKAAESPDHELQTQAREALKLIRG